MITPPSLITYHSSLIIPRVRRCSRHALEIRQFLENHFDRFIELRIFAFVLVSSDSQKTLPVGLASILGTFDARWGELMAGATLIALPLLILFTFLSRYFIQGLAAGSMKG